MKNVKTVVDQMNSMRRIFNEQQLDFSKLDADMADMIFVEIDVCLSPESLYQDGERPRAQANKLRKLYEAAIAELNAAGYRPKFDPFHF